MNRIIPISTNNEQCTIKAFIQASSLKQVFNCSFKHATQAKTEYYNNTQHITAKGYFYIRLPQSPEKGILTITSLGGFAMLKPELEFLPLNQKLEAFNYKNPLVKEFVNFAQVISEDFVLFSSNGTAIQSKNLNFRVDIHKQLVNRKTGKVSTTPARLVDLSIIELASDYYVNYTVPERFVILCHEFAHGWLNRKAASEFEADKNALDICLGLGYPRSAIKKVFFSIFKNAPTAENKQRWDMICDYIDNFAKADVTDDYYYSKETK